MSSLLNKLLTGASLLFITYSVNAVELHLYAGAGLRQPVEIVVKQFEQKSGNKVMIEYGGSGQLLTRVNLTNRGDVFLAGSAGYVEKLQRQDRVALSFPLVLHTPVMVVRKAAGKNIHSLADVARSDLKLGMGDAKAIALGKSGERLLAASGFDKVLKAKVVVQTTTIKQLLIYLLNGDIDAAVIGRSDAIKHQSKLKLLPSPSGTPEEVATIAVLKNSQHPEEAKQLAAFFSSAEGINVFTRLGYLPVDTQ